MAPDPTPLNPLEMILRLAGVIILALSAVVGFASDPGLGQGGGAPPDIGGPTMQSFHTIEVVDAFVLESLPVQIRLEVRGYIPDGCQFPTQVLQMRDGNNITVQIYRDMPSGVMCSMQLQPYQDSILLDGTFEPGTYTIMVNDQMVTVTV